MNPLRSGLGVSIFSVLPEETTMPRNKSKVHPKYKTKYRVGNWAAYDRSLVDRGAVRW